MPSVASVVSGLPRVLYGAAAKTASFIASVKNSCEVNSCVSLDPLYTRTLKCTVHVHFKVRVYSGSSETLEFTSQLFFTDAMNDAVFAAAPYSTRGNPDTTDATDGIYGADGSS